MVSMPAMRMPGEALEVICGIVRSGNRRAAGRGSKLAATSLVPNARLSGPRRLRSSACFCEPLAIFLTVLMNALYTAAIYFPRLAKKHPLRAGYSISRYFIPSCSPPIASILKKPLQFSIEQSSLVLRRFGDIRNPSNNISTSTIKNQTMGSSASWADRPSPRLSRCFAELPRRLLRPHGQISPNVLLEIAKIPVYMQPRFLGQPGTVLFNLYFKVGPERFRAGPAFGAGPKQPLLRENHPEIIRRIRIPETRLRSCRDFPSRKCFTAKKGFFLQIPKLVFQKILLKCRQQSGFNWLTEHSRVVRLYPNISLSFQLISHRFTLVFYS